MTHDTEKSHEPGNKLWRELQLLAERTSRDALSGLLNRDTATSYIKQYLQNMHEDDACALFIIDLDNFKQVNDTLGHQAGDRVINRAARALASCFRATDIVGRLGGDEFFVLLTGASEENMVREKAKKICETLQFSIGAAPTIHITASVGVHVATGGNLNFELLYEHADSALYKAKDLGKNRFCIGGAGARRQREKEHAPVPMTIQLYTLLEYMDGGVSLDEVGDVIRIIYANPGFRKMMNVESSITLPCTLDCIHIHPDDKAEYEAALREALKNGNVAEHVHRFSANGRDWRWRHVRAVRLSAFDSGKPVMLALSTDISAIKKNEELLWENHERLRLSLEQTDQILWEVDIAEKTFGFFDAKKSWYMPRDKMENFPESLISRGWVHPDSAARFREFSAALLGGSPEDGGVFILQHRDGANYSWAAVSYRTLFDNAGRAIKAIGAVERLTDTNAHRKFITKGRLWEALRPNLFCYLWANISTDELNELWLEGKKRTGRAAQKTYQACFENEKRALFFKEDAREFSRLFSRDALLEAFEQGLFWTGMEYRRIDGAGNIRWLSHMVNLAKDPATHDIHAFVFLRDVEWRHAREIALGKSIRHEPQTGLYDKQTTQALVEHELHIGIAAIHMLALVRINGLSGPWPDSQKNERHARRLVFMVFAALLSTDCIVGSHDNDHLVIFCPNAVSRFEARQKIEDAFTFVRRALADTGITAPLRFVAGAICGDLRGAAYESLLLEAGRVCDMRMNAPSDAVIFFSEAGDEAGAMLHAAHDDDAKRSIYSWETKRPLSDQAKDVAIHCLGEMLKKNASGEPVVTVLQRIGRYYRADRAYTLALVEDRRAVAAIHEWATEGKRSIKQYISGSSVDSLPMLKHCLKTNASSYLSKKTSHPADIQDTAQGTWAFGAFPLICNENAMPEGFLCLENPKAHTDDIALIDLLRPHIARSLKYARPVNTTEPGLDMLTSLPNLRSYIDKKYIFTSDAYSSMGALAIDVPRFAAIRDRLGSEHGDALLLYIAETLAGVFNRSFLFRTWDAEFVALCPNTTQEVFLARILRTRSMLQRRYPKLLRFGYTWADGIFSGEKLVEEARAIMRCKTDIYPSDTASSEHTAAPPLMRTLSLGRFAVYFQPKMDMRTGAFIGAEALVRGFDSAGRVIPPGNFIESMEKTGAIRDLDFQVLAQTLSHMDEWRARGRKLFRVSVNFSRLTLFDFSSPGSVLALLSRYPTIPPDLIEIEITETGGDIGNSTLECVMDVFRAFGLRFALDDFGSRYANLSVFTNVTFDTVKLDRSLIREISHNAVSRTLVGNITRICDSRGITCIAEGVETLAQIAALREEGCTYAQGFYYDRPLPVQEFEQKYL